MRFRLCAAALGLSLLVAGLSGCGGGGSSSANNTVDFQGEYLGTFGGTTNGAPETGTLSTTVAADGALTGTAHSNTNNADGAVTGTLSNTGAFNSTFAYPGGSVTLTGTVVRDSRRHLIGTLTEFSGATAIGTLSIDLTRQ